MAKDSNYFIKYDTAALNRAVPIEQALGRYMGVQVHDRRQIHCPKPEHVDKKPSATVYHNTNTCHCFSCNSTFKPVDIAQIAMPNLKFIEVCERLCDDFGLDPYQFSNKGEIEDLRKDGNSSKHKFIERFPLDENDLEAIGVENTTSIPKPVIVEVTAEEYDLLSCGEEFVKKTKEKNPNAYILPNGMPDTMEITYGELDAIAKGKPLFDEITKERITNLPNEMYLKPIRLQWEEAIKEHDIENRDMLESLLKNMAYNAIDKYNGVIETNQAFINNLKTVLSSPDKMQEARKWYMGYIYAVHEKHITPKLTPNQSALINAYQLYQPCQEILNSAKKGLEQAETALSKLDKYQAEREKEEKLSKKGFNYNR